MSEGGEFPMETVEHILWFCDSVIVLTEDLKKWEPFQELGFSETPYKWLIFDYRVSVAKQIAINSLNWLCKYFCWTARMCGVLPDPTGCRAYIKFQCKLMKSLISDPLTKAIIKTFADANI